MTTYEDKTKGIIASEGHFVLPVCEDCDDVTFKASYIVVSRIKCSGKITALFDLVVLGDVEAAEIDVKGKFVCLGNCTINGSIVAQNGIWANDLRATNVESGDKIVAQKIDSSSVLANGSILIASTLNIDRTAESKRAIVCGETVFGAGIIAAEIIKTLEPLDLDDGEKAVVSNRQQLKTEKNKSTVSHDALNETVKFASKSIPSTDNYNEYLDWLIENSEETDEKQKYEDWKSTLAKASAFIAEEDERIDLSLLIRLAEIYYSDRFANCSDVIEMFISLDSHYLKQINNNSELVYCYVSDFSDWLMLLHTLMKCDIISLETRKFAFERLFSTIGLKEKYVMDRLDEKGWQKYV